MEKNMEHVIRNLSLCSWFIRIGAFQINSGDPLWDLQNKQVISVVGSVLGPPTSGNQYNMSYSRSSRHPPQKITYNNPRYKPPLRSLDNSSPRLDVFAKKGRRPGSEMDKGDCTESLGVPLGDHVWDCFDLSDPHI